MRPNRLILLVLALAVLFVAGCGQSGDEDVTFTGAQQEVADAAAAELRAGCVALTDPPPLSLFDHVYAAPTPQLVEQREQVRAELAAARDEEGDA